LPILGQILISLDVYGEIGENNELLLAEVTDRVGPKKELSRALDQRGMEPGGPARLLNVAARPFGVFNALVKRMMACPLIYLTLSDRRSSPSSLSMND
jgi:hypothetical protein